MPSCPPVWLETFLIYIQQWLYQLAISRRFQGSFFIFLLTHIIRTCLVTIHHFPLLFTGFLCKSTYVQHVQDVCILFLSLPQMSSIVMENSEGQSKTLGRNNQLTTVRFQLHKERNRKVRPFIRFLNCRVGNSRVQICCQDIRTI